MRYELRFGLLGPPVLYDGRGDDERQGEGGRGNLGVRTDDLGVRTDGLGVRTVRSPKARALLAALLLEAGRTVSVESLKDALWGGAPPASAQASLHNHVTRLRRLLDDSGRLRAVPPGYLLRVEHGELDVHVFERHMAAARGAHAAQNWERVVRESTAALALWRGTPLSGLPAEVGGYAFVQRLQEARLLLMEWRYDAELALGGARLGALVPEVAALAAEHPLREAYHRQLMLALHRTGRQPEALAVHRDLRARLVEELGIEPGPAVREAHVEVLRGAVTDRAVGETPASEPGTASEAPTSAPTSAPASSPTPGSAPASTPRTTVTPAPDATREEDPPPSPPQPPPRPAQLPPPPGHFTGRAAVLNDLDEALTPTPTAPPSIAVISGMAGVGKSALALYAAHGLRERFPDGQLYVHLHGATPGMTPLTAAQALTALLRDLGTDPRGIPEHPDAAAALLRSLLAPTRTLMVLDDAESAAQVRPLLPAGPGCAVIVTSRSPLTALDGAHRFPLAPLSHEESAALLRAASGRGGGDDQDGQDGDGGDGQECQDGDGGDEIDATHPLIELTGRLPLALRVVAARLAARRALTPDVLADQLAATEGRLRHLEYDDLSVRRSLAVAHDALAASGRRTDRDAALILCRIGALDLPAYGVPLVARLLGAEECRAEEALDRLVDVALLEETAYGRYAPHDLVRDFARELADARHAPDIARTAVRWYTAVAERTLTAIVEPGLDRDDRLGPTAVQPPEHVAHVLSVPPFASSEEAFTWGESELENIVALVERYADAPDERTAAHVSTLLRLFVPFLQRAGRVAEMEVLGEAALGLARRLGDESGEAYALGDLAGLHFLTGRQSEALDLNDRALAIWRRLGAVSWIRRCLNNRGLLLEGLGRHPESERALRQSLAYSRRLDDRYGEAVTHSHLGNLYEHTDPRAAIEQHRLSLAIGDEIGNVIVQHSAHCNIGYAHLTLGEPAEAAGHFEESLRILGRHGDWHGESQTRLGLVRALRLLGRTERAGLECAELLGRADARGDGYTGGLARHQHGLLLWERGRPREAREQWRSALDALEGTDENTVLQELRELLAELPD
ncbi:BTAD domain-containing putative transcriptional regulator [Streptomyces sp. YU58]|uniref:AfsR/SARP family transcriptional regulator n=1 Tax=Streptomyces sp. SX92 TaxID=3158972 RepID=UPI0027B9532F|nr:BTAD domain-containing putative transcriptional regulator [Streptomyces coralus]WLW58486.1 BTAD domain-containing putative transcriptional regulator [Streptomyces coralus]